MQNLTPSIDNTKQYRYIGIYNDLCYLGHVIKLYIASLK